MDESGVDVIIVISVIAAGLLLVELLLPTGGVLAIVGAIGLVAAGVLAFRRGHATSPTTPAPG